MSTNNEIATLFDTTSGVILKSFKAALICASKDTTRPHMNGVLLEINQDCSRMVSTDGHRLVKIDFSSDTYKPGCSYLIERQSIEDALKLFKDTKKTEKLPASVTDSGSRLVLTIGDRALPLRLADKDHTFPPYKSVIPELGTTGIGQSIGMSARYLSDVGAVATALGAQFVKLTPLTDNRNPLRFEIKAVEVAEATLVLMPVRI